MSRLAAICRQRFPWYLPRMRTGERTWKNMRETGATGRRFARYPVSLWALETHSEGSYFHHVQDLSLGGFFIRKAIPIPVGTELNLLLELPTGNRINATGRVVHAVVSDDRCGNGVELGVLTREDRAALQDFLGDGEAFFN